MPDAGRVRTYAYWAALAGLAFFAVYPALNRWTAARPDRLHLFVATELEIPFVPQFIWAYLSMYLVFLLPLFLLPAARMPALGKQLLAGTLVCGVLFALLPADLGFQRVIPADPVYAPIYAAIFGIDRPHNLVPSLHVTWSAAIIGACADVAGPVPRVLLYAGLAVIASSTVLVHQHHLLDLAAAALLVLFLRRLFKAPDA